MSIQTIPRGSGRLIALDAARGLAVIGMFIQHFALNEFNASIVSGNTTLLFVLCGGISYSIMAKGMLEKDHGVVGFRTRMLARAVFIDLIGYFLIMLNTPFGVILPAYAALFVLALLLVRRSTRIIATTAAVLLVLSPPLMLIGGSLFSESYLLSDIAGGAMSALALAPAFVAGMVIGRVDLAKVRTAILLATSGVILFALPKWMAVAVLPEWRQSFENWLVGFPSIVNAQPDPYAIWPDNVYPPLWQMLLGTAPHSASTFQTMMGLGIAFLLLGVVILIAKKATVVLKPFAVAGRVALTLYVTQFVVVWVLERAGIDLGLSEIPFGDLIVTLATILMGWLLTRLPNGPLETVMRRFDQLFTVDRSSIKQATN